MYIRSSDVTSDELVALRDGICRNSLQHSISEDIHHCGNVQAIAGLRNIVKILIAVRITTYKAIKKTFLLVNEYERRFVI